VANVRLTSWGKAVPVGVNELWTPGEPLDVNNSENARSIFQIGAIFINKSQISALNNHILAWNTLKITFHDTKTVVFYYYVGFLLCYWRLLVGVRCILGYLAVSHPQKSPLDASSVNGVDQENIRGFEMDLARCELLIGTVLGQWLMTFYKSTRTQVQTRMHIEKRPLFLSHVVKHIKSNGAQSILLNKENTQENENSTITKTMWVN